MENPVAGISTIRLFPLNIAIVIAAESFDRRGSNLPIRDRIAKSRGNRGLQEVSTNANQRVSSRCQHYSIDPLRPELWSVQVQVTANWRGSACWPVLEDKWPGRNMQPVYRTMQLEAFRSPIGRWEINRFHLPWGSLFSRSHESSTYVDVSIPSVVFSNWSPFWWLLKMMEHFLQMYIWRFFFVDVYLNQLFNIFNCNIVS